MIYFIRLGRKPSDPIKIGHAQNVRARAACLKNTRKVEVFILGVLPGARREEAELHKRFVHLRQGRAEHFDPAADLLDYIETNAQPLESPCGCGSERDDVTVKVDRTLVGKAKLVATHRGIPVAELLTELLGAPVDRAYMQMLKELEARGGKH